MPSLATVKNYHKLESLKQQFILSQFWRSRVWNRGVSRALLLLNSLWENPPLLLPASGGLRCSLVWQQNSSHCFRLHMAIFPVPLCIFSLFPLLWRYLSLDLGLTLIQDDLKVKVMDLEIHYLIISAMTLFQNKFIVRGSRSQDMDITLAGWAGVSSFNPLHTLPRWSQLPRHEAALKRGQPATRLWGTQTASEEARNGEELRPACHSVSELRSGFSEIRRQPCSELGSTSSSPRQASHHLQPWWQLNCCFMKDPEAEPPS